MSPRPNFRCIQAQFHTSRKFLVCSVFLGLMSTACATAITTPTPTSKIISGHDVLFAGICRNKQGALIGSEIDLFKNKQTGQAFKESCIPHDTGNY